VVAVFGGIGAMWRLYLVIWVAMVGPKVKTKIGYRVKEQKTSIL
jgi:hypothetical protein